MRQQDFDELVKSVRQAGKIRRGRIGASREEEIRHKQRSITRLERLAPKYPNRMLRPPDAELSREVGRRKQVRHPCRNRHDYHQPTPRQQGLALTTERRTFCVAQVK